MFWWRRKVIQDYQTQLAELKAAGRASGLTDAEIEFVLEESLVFIERNQKKEKKTQSPHIKTSRRSWRYKFTFILFVICIGYCFNFCKPVHNFVERNIQEIIYPFMTSYRRLTLPIVKSFPVVTELYDESCLLENPYFQVSDMECWPCENARVVLNLTESISKAHVGLPFVMKMSDTPVTLLDVRNAYLTYKSLIDGNAGRLVSNVGWKKVSELLTDTGDLATTRPDAHVTWRINRMETGRVLRSLLKPPRGRDVPSYASSAGIERFVLVDGPTSPHYPLPSTEGANVFLKQLSGQRLIVLEPAPECRGSCRRMSLLLLEQHTLWYNWWYWRPRSLPVQNASSVSVALLGSTV